MQQYIKNTIPIENIDDLPSYPIPSLTSTLDRYLEWAETLVSEDALNTAKHSVEAFLQSEASTKLEDKLIELGERENDSWIYDYWVKCHLDVRAPLSPHTNVPIVYENKTIEKYSLLQQIAIIIYAVSKSYIDFRENGPKKYSLNKKEYSSDQFTGLLGAINHIKETTDEYYINPDISDIMVFTYKNHFHKIKVIENGEVVPANAIYQTLKAIVDTTETPEIPNANYVTVGVDRDKAGRLLEEILANDTNRTAYDAIKDSIFIFNLDDIESNAIIENLDNATYDPHFVNRWHGKALQFSSSKNGVFSFIADHCFVDGGTELLMVNKIKNIIDQMDFIFSDNITVCDAQPLAFELTEEISQKLMALKSEFDDCMKSFKTSVVNFESLTRAKLRESGVLSGDGFMHLAFQAAQYLTFNEVFNTYISVDARKYFRGRTECNRPVSKQSLAFAKSLFDQNLSEDDFQTLLHEALNEHHRRVKICQAGEGVNRYLFVLESIYKDFKGELNIEEEPNLFKTEAYEVMSNNRLSTTSFTHENMKYLYFPPVVDNGFGIYYLVDDPSFAIITAYNEHLEDLDKFTANLKLCINVMLEKLMK